MFAMALVHLLAALHFWYGCYFDWYYVQVPKEVHNMGESFGHTGKLKFLTYWNALLQAFFFTVCLLNDFIGTNENYPNKTPFIRKFKDMTLCCLAFPLSMFVGISFWGLYAINRELIFPKVLDEFFPAWLNHVMHTNIMFFIVLEMLTSYRKYPDRSRGLTVLVTFMASYLVWIHVLNIESGKWVYPILEVLNLPARMVFFALSLFIVIGLYVFGENLNNVWWARVNTHNSQRIKSK